LEAVDKEVEEEVEKVAVEVMETMMLESYLCRHLLLLLATWGCPLLSHLSVLLSMATLTATAARHTFRNTREG
jgi:hypothetical protein